MSTHTHTHTHSLHYPAPRYNRDKLETHVEFPLQGLDLSRHVQQQQAPGSSTLLYDLYAVSNHFGSLGGGHYTAYAKMPDGK